MRESNASPHIALLSDIHLSHHVLMMGFEMPVLLDLDLRRHCLLLREFALTFCSTPTDTKS